MNYQIQKFIDPDQIKAKVCEMADQISKDYEGKEILLVGLLKGSVMFVADLARAIDSTKVDVCFDFMTVQSYGNKTTSGEVLIVKDLDEPVAGRHVLIVEDIIDTAKTLYSVKQLFATRNPASFKIATLLDKPERRVKDVKVDYVGFEIPDKFIVGYGIDYAQKYRQLPYIGLVEFTDGE